MSRIKIFFVNGILLTFSSIGIRFVDIVFNVYISNKIGSEAVGVYQLIISVYLFFITLSTSGINLATTRIISEQDAYGSDYSIKNAMKTCLSYSLFMGCLACLILFLFAPFASSYFLHSKVSELPLQILACSLPFLSLASCINGYFSGLVRVKKTVFYQFFGQFVKITSIFLFLNILFDINTVEIACISLVLSSAISEITSFIFLFLLFLKDKKTLLSKSFVAKEVNFRKQILKIAIPISFTSYIRSGLSSLKHILIPIQLEKSGIACDIALSNYGIINGMAFPIIMFPCCFIYSFSSLLIPEFSYMNAKKENSKMKLALNKIIKICFIFSILIMGIFWCFAHEFSDFIYPNTDISFYIKALCPLIPLMYIDNVVDSILKGLNKQVPVMGINILDLITTILLIYFLLPTKGVTGYIISLYVSEVLNSFLSLLLLVKTTNFKIDFTNYLIKPILVILILKLTFSFSFFKNIASVFLLVFYCVTFIILYFIILFLFKSIARNNII